jgi:hypothetical protein
MAEWELKSLKDLEYAAGELLALDPGPVVRHRLLRDVFRLPPGDALAAAAREAALESPLTRSLPLPRDPGRMGWTVRRALCLGLDAGHPLLAAAVTLLSRAMAAGMARQGGGFAQPGAWDRVSAAGSMLARIDPAHAGLDDLWSRWLEVARASFGSGRYRAEDELEARAACFPARGVAHGPGLVSDQALVILAARGRAIPPMIEELLLDLAFKRLPGLGRAAAGRGRTLAARAAGDAWFSALETLSAFRLGLVFAEPQVFEIWGERGPDGLWDRWHSPLWRLSEGLENRKARRVDVTTRVLVYLRKNWGC